MGKRTTDTNPRPATDDPVSKRTRGRADAENDVALAQPTAKAHPTTAAGPAKTSTPTSGQGAEPATSKPETSGDVPPAPTSIKLSNNGTVSTTSESSETESTGPTTPVEWEKSDDETDNGPNTSATGGTATVNAVTGDGGALAPAESADRGVVVHAPQNVTMPVTAGGATCDGPGAQTALVETPAVAVMPPAPPAAPAVVQAAPTGTQVVAATEPGHATIAAPALGGQPLVTGNLTDEQVMGLFLNIDYVPLGDKRRMLAFAQKKDDVNLRYAISQIPSNAKWGSTSKTAKLLCVNDKPITVWAIGDVETTWFRDLQGNPHERVNVGYRLPFSFDKDALKRLYSLARPARDMDDVVYASRRMTVYRKGDIMPTYIPFENLFDARKRFQAKSQMPRLESSAIGKRDVVLIEGKFTRWNAAKEQRGRREWKLWGVGFELEAVSLLYEAPEGLEPPPTAEVADIDDDM